MRPSPPQNNAGRLPAPLRTLLALLCTLLWAGAQIGVKFGLGSAPPFALMAFRFTVASLLLWPVCVLVGSAFPQNRAAWGRLVVLGLLNNTLYLGLTALGLRHVSGGLSCVLTGINPLALALGGWLFFRERLFVQDVVGLVGALAGICWVMMGRLGTDNTLGGVATVFVANCVMVAGNLCYKRWQHESGLLVSHMVQLFVGGMTLWGLHLAAEPLGSIHFDAGFWAAELFLVFGVSFGAMLIWLFLLSQESAAKAGAFLFLVPIFGLLQGYYLLGEPLQGRDMLGALVTCGFVYLAQARKPEQAVPAATHAQAPPKPLAVDALRS